VDNTTVPILTISLADYLALTGKSGTDFNAVGVEYSGGNRVGSGYDLPSIKRLENRVREQFLAQLPSRTVVVLSVQEVMSENPSGLFSEGTQFVCFRGTALVAKSV
jgi:hypothetical protein